MAEKFKLIHYTIELVLIRKIKKCCHELFFECFTKNKMDIKL